MEELCTVNTRAVVLTPWHQRLYFCQFQHEKGVMNLSLRMVPFSFLSNLQSFHQNPMASQVPALAHAHEQKCSESSTLLRVLQDHHQSIGLWGRWTHPCPAEAGWCRCVSEHCQLSERLPDNAGGHVTGKELGLWPRNTAHLGLECPITFFKWTTRSCYCAFLTQ